MILIKKLLLILFKLLILLAIITLERVVGLPMIFITLLLVFFTNEKYMKKYIYLIFGALFLGLIYNLSFSLSLLFLVFLFLGIEYGDIFISNDSGRVLFFIYALVFLIAFLSKIDFGSGVVVYFIISSLITLIILMKTLFFRYGLTNKIVNKESNFFR